MLKILGTSRAPSIAEELRRSEAYLAEGQRLSHTGSWAWNVSSGELLWSSEHFRILGLDPETAKTSYPTALQWIHPEDRSVVQQACRGARARQGCTPNSLGDTID